MLATVLLVLCASIIIFVIWSPWPAEMNGRITAVIYGFAIAGVPLGIKYGCQDKFWT